MSQKSIQNQKLKLKKRLIGRYTNSKLLRFFTHNICAGDTKRLTSSKLFWFTIHHKSHNNIYALARADLVLWGPWTVQNVCST